MKKLLYFIIALISWSNVLFAQEVSLVDLNYNPNIVKQANTNRFADVQFIYIIDTLQLPFVDDFSNNFQLRYDGYFPGANYVLDSAQSVYRFGSQVMDSIKYRKTPTYSYFYSSITNKVDTIKNDTLLIEIFDDSEEIYVPYDYGYPATENYYSNGQLVDQVAVTYDSLLTDSVWYKYYVNDTSKHWIDNGVWINTTMGIDPPTIGVATFDGVDSLGHPYDFSNEGSYGLADYLTSYPIDLEGKENVKISFYYQAQGYGNQPEGKDSLVLEFYGNDRWNYAWSVPGIALNDFTYVEVPINNIAYLYKGFQFRFKNYSTLSGSLDHWNIDYVYLNDDRTTSSTALNDLAFKQVPRTLINNYVAMPYEHYIAAPASFMKNDVDLDLVNFSTLNLSGHTDYKVYDWTNRSKIFDAEDINIITFPAFGKESFNHSILAANNTFQFPNTGQRTNKFKIQYIANSNTIQASEINPHNDTISINQIFDNYYAYDDGSPESGFAIAGDGATVALKFTINVSDTITGLLINFLEMFENVDNTFVIKLWQDVGGSPGTILYESGTNVVPQLEPEPEFRTPLTFTRYVLDTAIVLPAGTYHIGWRQNRLNKFFIGYDMNNDASANFVYNLGSGWNAFEEPGAIMMRPEFGVSELQPVYSLNIQQNDEQQISIYPNPTSQYFSIEASYDQKLYMQVMDAYGRLILQQNISSQQQISTSHWAQGIYSIAITGEQINETHKIIVQH